MATVDRRADIIAYVVSELGKITVSNGYLNNVIASNVYSDFMRSETMPVSELRIEVDDTGNETAIDNLIGGHAVISFEIFVIATVPRASPLSSIDADIKRCLALAGNFGGLITSMMATESTDRSSGASGASRRVIRPFLCVYQALRIEGL